MLVGRSWRGRSREGGRRRGRLRVGWKEREKEVTWRLGGGGEGGHVKVGGGGGEGVYV